MRTSALLAFLLLACSAAFGGEPVPAPLEGVGFDQRLGADLPRDLHFLDETGRDVELTSLTRGRPALLTLVYYRCPMLCTQVADGLVRGLQPVTLEPGADYDVVFVSIDPTETPDLAAAKKRETVRRFGRAGTAAGWHFLTGDEASIRRLADAVGFRYRFDAHSGQFAHAAGVVVLTPGARIARYLFGIEFKPTDLRLSLVEATGGAIAGPVDAILLYCFCWDPAAGRYGAAVMNLLRLAGGATVLALGGTIFALSRRRRATGAAA
jgi:protein SCO1/2